MTKRLIAKDTGKPLRVLGAYDIAADGERVLSTSEFGDGVVEALYDVA